MEQQTIDNQTAVPVQEVLAPLVAGTTRYLQPLERAIAADLAAAQAMLEIEAAAKGNSNPALSSASATLASAAKSAADGMLDVAGYRQKAIAQVKAFIRGADELTKEPVTHGDLTAIQLDAMRVGRFIDEVERMAGTTARLFELTQKFWALWEAEAARLGPTQA